MTIILPDEDRNEEEENVEINYEATEKDEQCFFLMYHMNFQPSEAEKLDPEHRKWLIARFVAQKNMEREAMERNRLLSQIGPSLKVPS
jgi:hypothetical protein